MLSVYTAQIIPLSLLSTVRIKIKRESQVGSGLNNSLFFNIKNDRVDINNILRDTRSGPTLLR